ncbi:MAG: hypothetical protein ACKOPO_11860 [Novosphingobium sp.]
MRTASAIALSLILAFPAQAASRAPLKLDGAWRFASTVRDSKTFKPVCTETWTFSTGKMRVESGEEVAEKQFRTLRDRTGNWLATRAVSTNFMPDCTGNVSTAIDPAESRIYLLPMNGGDIMVCPPPARTAKGIPLIAECFGTLTRAGR